ncbi:MAG: ABC transporter ATP-binding protein, partial [Anaerolineae bacterium]|nr:ABC transporter ATP-binding protein [Anaerolineae bacterium]
MNTAIRFEDVSKRFALHQQRSRSFQEALIRLAPWRRTNQNASEEFWALRHVSFEIETGETVGLIGPNGVGKSTALKLVSRILEPTSGHIEVHGRVGALLELGAGFHPDLTGRENVYLNASMMGLSRQEVDRRFDEIVAFSELEPFIDVPVKHYSSGMYVRLGFAVAVHTDPEILLVDEVLAVGDAAFQRKCYDRIDQLRANGVTLLFVSHSAETVRSLCKRALWLDAGTLVADGTAESVVQQYTVHSWEAEEGKLPSPDNVKRWGTGRVQITRVELLDGAGKER